MIWRHVDPNMSASANAGLAALQAADWSAPLSAGVRKFQGLLALKAMIVGELCGTINYTDSGEGDVSGDLSSAVGDRADAARALLAPLRFYAAASGVKPQETDVETVAPSDVGAFPVVIVVAIIAGSGLLGWCAHEAASVVKYFKTANDQKAALEKADAAATAMLAKHIEQEKAAGKPIELTDAEKQYLATLKQTSEAMTKAIAAQNERPEPVLPWYVWAGAGALGVVALAYLVTRPGRATIVALPKTAEAA